MSEYMAQWLNQTWIIVLAVVSGVTAIWKFKGILKEMNDEIKKPIIEINDRLKLIEESDSLKTNALLTLQRKIMLDLCEECLRNGYSSLEQQKVLSEMYESYHHMGGNSWVTDLVKRVESLPIRKD